MASEAARTARLEGDKILKNDMGGEESIIQLLLELIGLAEKQCFAPLYLRSVESPQWHQGGESVCGVKLMHAAKHSRTPIPLSAVAYLLL